MRKTYEVYYSSCNEPLKLMYNMYSDDEREILRQILKLVETLVDFQGFTKTIIVISGNKQILNFTF